MRPVPRRTGVGAAMLLLGLLGPGVGQAAGGEPLRFKQSGGGFFSLDFGQPNLHDRPDAVTIAGETVPIASLGMETVEIEDAPAPPPTTSPRGSWRSTTRPARRPATARVPRSPSSRSRRRSSRHWAWSHRPTWRGRPCSPNRAGLPGVRGQRGLSR